MNSAVDTALQLAEQLTDPGRAEAWVGSLGGHSQGPAPTALRRLSDLSLPIELLATTLRQVAVFFEDRSGVEVGIVNLETFFERARSPLALATLFERDAEALPILLRVLAIEGPLAKIMMEDVESFDVLRVTQGRSISRDALLADLRGEIDSLDNERSVSLALRRFRDRESLRIGYGLLSGDATAAWASEQLSQLAGVLSAAALEHCKRRHSKPSGLDPASCQLTVLALGEGGAQLMHFKSALQFVFVFEEAPPGRGPQATCEESAERVAKATEFLLFAAEASPYVAAKTFQLELNPIRHAIPADLALRALDQFGRTWQRLEMLPGRVVAGDQILGASFLNQLEPWLYRRRLSDSDVDGLRFQFRKWRRCSLNGDLDSLYQGIRILQLMLGGEHVEVRGANPVAAISALSGAGAWEQSDGQALSEKLEVLAKGRLLHQLGVSGADEDVAKKQFSSAHRIIAAALSNLFGDSPSPAPLSELVMNPLPTPEEISEAVALYGFENTLEAGAALSELAQESSPFLSTRKSRHFLAQIAPALAACLANTPSPDHALFVLTHVVQSLGAKGALWELFLANPPSMELCVRLCAYAPYLSNILIASPGLIDELLDSLQLARLPSLSAMESRLDDLCKGAELDQAIHEFKNALHLRIGVRDILGKEQISSTHQALAQTAEAILRRVVAEQYKELAQKHGKPWFDATDGARECRHVLLVSSKVGALEPNYHSEVDFAVIYEGDGMTRPDSKSMAAVSCAHFFGQLVQRSQRKLTSRGGLGQLYAVNSGLRPLGSHGPLAASLEALRNHYLDTDRSWRDLLWLCKTRPARGEVAFATDVMSILGKAMAKVRITAADVGDFRQYRFEQEEGAQPLNLKRAAGGTQHIELLVQFLQLAFAGRFPRILAPGTLTALDRLQANGLISTEEANTLAKCYQFLRSVESRLRLMNTQARHDLPESETELRSLAMFVGADAPEGLRAQCEDALRDAKAIIEGCEVRLAKESFA